MSGVHPTPRDKLERDYLALAKKRYELVAPLDAQLLTMQHRLKQFERGISISEWHENRDTGDINRRAIRMDNGANTTPSKDEVIPPPDPYTPYTLRLMALLTGVLQRVVKDPHRPKLEAYAALLALGADCYSMRTIAKLEGVSPECVSLRTKAIRRDFNLPKNHHNGHGAADWAPPSEV